MKWMSESHNIVDIIHGVIPYDGLEGRVIESPIFLRLYSVLQSSLVYLTYPSNKVHRFEHSIGVMHLAGLFFYHSICNSDEKNIKIFFKEISEALKALLNNEGRGLTDNDFTYNSGQNIQQNLGVDDVKRLDCALFRQYTPSNLSQQDLFLYYVVYEAVRLVGLLHDVGHLPYSHITEFALKRLYRKFKNSNKRENIQAKIFWEIMEEYGINDNSDTQMHEKVGLALTRKIFNSVCFDLKKDRLVRIFVIAVFELTLKVLEAPKKENSIFSDLHRIVDGVVDCDRMDYCCRDLYCAGISKDTPHYDRIFSNVKIFYVPISSSDKRKQRCHFVYNSKAIEQIEALLQRRWEDFATINFHHRVHKHELLLELVISDFGEEELNIPLEPQEDSKYIAYMNNKRDAKKKNILPFEISSIWETMSRIEQKGPVDLLVCQLDDEWLDTLIKNKYFKKYGKSIMNREEDWNNVELNRLDELITRRKHYVSLFKRADGFRQFDAVFCEKYNLKNKEKELDTGDYFLNIKLNELEELGKEKGRDILKDYYRIVNNKLSKKIKSLGVIDCILGEIDFSIGIDDGEEPLICPASGGCPERLVGNRIIEDLRMRKKLLPRFHIYYLPKSDMTSENKEKFQCNLQEKIAKMLADEMKRMLKEKKK